jgi:hypothetical protein
LLYGIGFYSRDKARFADPSLATNERQACFFLPGILNELAQSCEVIFSPYQHWTGD